jgi:hypothetical protein
MIMAEQRREVRSENGWEWTDQGWGEITQVQYSILELALPLPPTPGGFSPERTQSAYNLYSRHRVVLPTSRELMADRFFDREN